MTTFADDLLDGTFPNEPPADLDLYAPEPKLPSDDALPPEVPLIADDALVAAYAAQAAADEAVPRFTLPDDFWSTPTLQRIRAAAYARGRSADAVLLVLLARLASRLPSELWLPPIVGTRAAPNFFVALIGPSGSGKSSSVGVASELLPYYADDGLDLADGRPLGSGEGLAELFMGTVETVDANGKTKATRQQVRRHAFVYVDEGQSISTQASRQGATIAEALRTGWSGGTLGQSNGTAERTRLVTGYRLGLAASFQPANAGRLLADAHGGTPQRFMFASVIDPSIPDDPPDWPGPLHWPGVDAVLDEGRQRDGHAEFVIAPSIRREVVAEDLAVQRGRTTRAPLDSHEPLHRLKCAALLAALEGRIVVTADDWRLAGTMWTTSCAVRSWVAAEVAAEAERDEARSTARLAQRELATEAARQSAPSAVERYALRVATGVHQAEAASPGQVHRRRDLGQRFNSRDRALLPAVLVHAIAQGWLIEAGSDTYRVGPVKP